MSEVSYRCPDTGLMVHAWTSAKDAEGDDVCETVVCVACQRTHLINVTSGRVIGQDGTKRAKRT